MIAIVVAMDKNRLIGSNGQLPWHLPNDLANFRRLTIGHHSKPGIVIMGRKTFESIGRPLPGRTNVVITRHPEKLRPYGNKIICTSSLAKALTRWEPTESFFIIGGGEIYRQAILLADRLYVTEILAEFSGDTYFPEINPNIWEKTEAMPYAIDNKNPYPHIFVTYERRKK